MNDQDEDLIERGWSPGETLAPPPRSRAAFERANIRRSIADLERLERVERGASTTNIDKLLANACAEIACVVLTGSPRGIYGQSIHADKATLITTLMRALQRYAKKNPLAVNSTNDFSESNAVVMRKISRMSNVSEADAAKIPENIVARMRRLV